MSLLQFDDDVMPFTFSDVLILRYLLGDVDANQTVMDFDMINYSSDMNWSFGSHIKRFIKRFLKEPYSLKDKMWMQKLVNENSIKMKDKLAVLSRVIKTKKD